MGWVGGDVPLSARDVVQATFDEFGRSAGYARKASSWYRRSAETILVVNLQRSQYGPSYYVNVALWLLALGPGEAPKEHDCHVRTRLDDLVPRDCEHRLTALLDLESPIDDVARREELLALLNSTLLPLADASATLEGLRSVDGERLINASLVEGDAQRLLATGP